IHWSGSNVDPNPISGVWSDAVYLSADSTWDLSDKLVGRVEQNRTLAVNGSYSAQLTSTVPGTLPGEYHFIVRTDIFDTIPEGDGESNNQAASTTTLHVSLNQLFMGVPVVNTLAQDQSRYYALTAAA